MITFPGPQPLRFVFSVAALAGASLLIGVPGAQAQPPPSCQPQPTNGPTSLTLGQLFNMGGTCLVGDKEFHNFQFTAGGFGSGFDQDDLAVFEYFPIADDGGLTLNFQGGAAQSAFTGEVTFTYDVLITEPTHFVQTVTGSVLPGPSSPLSGTIISSSSFSGSNTWTVTNILSTPGATLINQAFNDVIQGVNEEQVPAPLPIFGAAAAFGCSRRIRARIRNVA